MNRIEPWRAASFADCVGLSRLGCSATMQLRRSKRSIHQGTPPVAEACALPELFFNLFGYNLEFFQGLWT